MESIYHDLSTSKTLKDKAYLHLRQLIIAGKLEPGSRMLEEELSKQMNISRAPIREAMNMLEREGFATIIPRKGAIVSRVTPKFVQDIWEVRSVLEPYAARESIQLIPESEINRVYDLAVAAQQNPADLDLYMKCDLELHELLYKYKDNHLLKEYIATTAGHSLRVRFIVEHSESVNDAAVTEVCQEHMGIMQAMKKRDAQELYDAVLYHVRQGLRRYSVSIKE